MPSLTLKQSIQFDSKNTLGIAPIDSNSFYVTYLTTAGNLKVERLTKNTFGGYDQVSLHAPGQATMSPALVNYNGNLYLFYREESSDLSNDKDIYYTLYNGSSWSSAQHPSGVKASTDHNPVIANYNNEIWLIDKNNTHHFIAETWMHSSGNWHTNDNKTYWDSDGDGKKDWGYVLSSHDKSNGGKKEEKEQILTSGHHPCNPCTPRNPSMAVFNNTIYVAYKGGRTSGDDKDEKLYIMTANANHAWTDPVQLFSGEKSKFAPALTACNGSLICVFARDDHSQHLYYSTSSNGTSWSSQMTKLSDDVPDNHKATDPFLMALDNSQVALSYVTGGKAVLNIYDFR